MTHPPAGRRRLHDTQEAPPIRALLDAHDAPEPRWPWFALAVAIAAAWALMLADAILAGQDAHHLQTEALYSRSVDTMQDQEPTP